MLDTWRATCFEVNDIQANEVLVPGILVTISFFLGVGVCSAQNRVDSDSRFEKLAADLYPKAKQEGSLVVYTIWDVEHIRSILAAFDKRFPGIDTTYWQGTRSDIVTRTLTEFQGDQKTADVILSEGAPVVLRAAGAITPYNTVQASSLLLHDPTLPTVSLQIMALSYNTKKLKPADLPKTWGDVTNPKYKSMVALDDPVRDVSFVGCRRIFDRHAFPVARCH